MPPQGGGEGRPLQLRLGFALAVATLLLAGDAAASPRVASINLCTDQLLVAIADPDQIVGLSPYARDETLSWAATEAGRHRILSGTAEDILVLKPDLVVGGRFTNRATRELLRAQGVRLVEFDAVRSIEEAQAQIRRMGEILGRRERAAAQVAAIDAAVARARRAAARKPLKVLPLQRRGWVSGSDSLMTDLLATAGLGNAAADLGLRSGGQVGLEAIVQARPDLLLVASGDAVAEDQGRAFLLHPALTRLYPPQRRIVIPERLTVCGGPMLAEALDRLAAEIERLGR